MMSIMEVIILEQRTIALEEGLSQYRQALHEAGFNTVEIAKGANEDLFADLVLVTGMNENMLGTHDTSTVVPVISVNGLSVREVVEMARQRLMH